MLLFFFFHDCTRVFQHTSLCFLKAKEPEVSQTLPLGHALSKTVMSFVLKGMKEHSFRKGITCQTQLSTIMPFWPI